MSWYDEPRTWYVLDLNTKQPWTLHEVTIPGLGMKGGYRSITSLEGFKNRILKRFTKDRKLRFITKSPEDYEFDLKHQRLGLFEEKNVSCRVKHEGLRSFYKAIGYDHKKNTLPEDRKAK